MKNLAIIPARSGSKCIKDKNIKIFNGKPLMVSTIEAAQKSELFDEIMVSTDSEQYAEIAIRNGAEVPFLRGKELATDTASSWDVVKDVIRSYKEIGKSFDTIALLQPTSPLRTSEDIVRGYKQMQDKNANTIISVCEVDHSPLWCNVLNENLELNNFLNEEVVNQPRQSLPTYYRINGALYIVKVDYLLSTDSIFNKECYAYVMDRYKSIDIDQEIDFKIAECLIK